MKKLTLTDFYELKAEVERLEKMVKRREDELDALKRKSARFVSRTYDLCKAVGMSERDTVVWFSSCHSLTN